MRNMLILCLLFSGVMLVSCSQKGEADDLIDEEIRVEENGTEIEPESETQEVEQEDQTYLNTWKSYHNERFDFCVDFPSNFLKEMGESENHDGNVFATANESSEMRASGMYNVLDETIEEAFESATDNGTYYQDEQVITYKQQKDNWFVVSGKYYESIFYARTVLKDGTFYTLYFEYHSSEAEKFKKIIDHTTEDFPGC